MTIVVMEARWVAVLPRVRALIRKSARTTFEVVRLRQRRTGVTLAIALAGDRQVRALNRDHRGKDSATNVLSYPSGLPPRRGEPRQLGDIVLAFQTICREARKQHKPFDHHVAHLVVHGILHLLGHDHLDDRQAEAMEAIERSVLARLGIDDPYVDR